ncbi:MAG: hypothetical protein DRN15_09200 [Thermoprotei archaeon]|nr:MAG: hypothetical protein DRM97_07735 [Thermoprotei archaeon]RLF22397.1 MAG: hypothetical protein DRN15_09200 [Thermoprotei archaeon]
MHEGFHLYAAIVKNLRGVVFSSDDINDFERGLRWLSKHFRYRSIGITPLMRKRYSTIVTQYLAKKQFVELVYPLADFKDLVTKLRRELNVEEEVLEAITLSSVYISPMIVIGSRSLEDLKDFLIDMVRTREELKDHEIKLHLRIVDYSVLDMYSWSTTNAEEILKAYIKREPYEKYLRKRKDKIRADKRRFWRIVEEEGEPTIIYLDILPLMLRRLKRESIGEIMKRHGKIISAILGVIVGFVVRP